MMLPPLLMLSPVLLYVPTSPEPEESSKFLVFLLPLLVLELLVEEAVAVEVQENVADKCSRIKLPIELVSLQSVTFCASSWKYVENNTSELGFQSK